METVRERGWNRQGRQERQGRREDPKETAEEDFERHGGGGRTTKGTKNTKRLTLAPHSGESMSNNRGPGPIPFVSFVTFVVAWN